MMKMVNDHEHGDYEHGGNEHGDHEPSGHEHGDHDDDDVDDIGEMWIHWILGDNSQLHL